MSRDKSKTVVTR